MPDNPSPNDIANGVSTDGREAISRAYRNSRIQKVPSSINQRRQSAAPGPPAIFVAAAGGLETVTFDFLVVNDPFVSAYNVYRSDVNNAGAAKRIDVVFQNPTLSGSMHYVDAPGLNKALFYWVSAVNVQGVESARVSMQMGDAAVTTGADILASLITDINNAGGTGGGGGTSTNFWRKVNDQAIEPIPPYDNIRLTNHGQFPVGFGIYKDPQLPLDVTVPAGVPGYTIRCYGASGKPGMLMGSTNGLSSGEGGEWYYDFTLQTMGFFAFARSSGGPPTYRYMLLDGLRLSLNAGSLGPVAIGVLPASMADDAWFQIPKTDAVTTKRANIRFGAGASAGLASPVDGSDEYFGSKRYFTVGTTRYQIAPYFITTKGDIQAFGSAIGRFPVSGNDTWVLTEDSTATFGFKWAAPTGGSGATVATPYLTDGSNFFHHEQQVALPSATTFTWTNQGTAVLTSGTNGDEYISAPSIASAFSLVLRKVAVGATWKVTGKLIPSYLRGSSAAPAIFLHAYDGTKVVCMDLVITADGATGSFVTGLSVTYWNSVTSLNGTQFSTNLWPAGDYWFRIEDNGTNMLFSISEDGDEAGDKNWTQILSAGHHSFLTGGATHVGHGVRANNGLGPNTDSHLVSFSVV